MSASHPCLGFVVFLKIFSKDLRQCFTSRMKKNIFTTLIGLQIYIYDFVLINLKM